MNKEQENAEKRKQMPLTNSEFLTFFFFPVSMTRGGFDNYEFNKDEDDRFIQHGFDKKLEQAGTARLYGKIFYISIGIIAAGIKIFYL